MNAQNPTRNGKRKIVRAAILAAAALMLSAATGLSCQGEGPSRPDNQAPLTASPPDLRPTPSPTATATSLDKTRQQERAQPEGPENPPERPSPQPSTPTPPLATATIPEAAPAPPTPIADGSRLIITGPDSTEPFPPLIVPCGGEWQYRVLSRIEMPPAMAHPKGEDILTAANLDCGQRHTLALAVPPKRWDEGERVILCLQANHPLAGGDHNLLDRLVSPFRLRPGDCYNQPGDGDEVSVVELVNCSDPWQFRADRVIFLDSGNGLPSPSALSYLASNACDLDSSVRIRPSGKEWRKGLRTMVCASAPPVAAPAPTPLAEPEPEPESGKPRLLDGIRNAGWLRNRDLQVMETLESLAWVTDGLTRRERRTAQTLIALITRKYSPQTVMIADDPFLYTLEGQEEQALMALLHLSITDFPAFTEIMDHPGFRDGVSDGEIPSLLEMARPRNAMAASTGPPTGGYEERESRNMDLPLAGPVRLTILRAGDRSFAGTMDLLEHAVRFTEKFMGAPFPVHEVVVVFDDKGPSEGAAATFLITHIAILESVEDDARRNLRGVNQLSRTMAHEVAHHYWRQNDAWVDEGMAEMIAALSEAERTGADGPLTPLKGPCPEYASISEIPDGAGHQCHYILGQSLFIKLREASGEEAFREKARTLYHASRNSGNELGEYIDIRQVEAIWDGATEQQATIRWYHGDPAP